MTVIDGVEPPEDETTPDAPTEVTVPCGCAVQPTTPFESVVRALVVLQAFALPVIAKVVEVAFVVVAFTLKRFVIVEEAAFTSIAIGEVVGVRTNGLYKFQVLGSIENEVAMEVAPEPMTAPERVIVWLPVRYVLVSTERVPLLFIVLTKPFEVRLEMLRVVVVAFVEVLFTDERERAVVDALKKLFPVHVLKSPKRVEDAAPAREVKYPLVPPQ